MKSSVGTASRHQPIEARVLRNEPEHIVCAAGLILRTRVAHNRTLATSRNDSVGELNQVLRVPAPHLRHQADMTGQHE